MARLRQQRAPRGDLDAASGHLGRWSELIIGFSYLWEGQVLLAERILRPALLQADADLGRRNPFSCMLAALLAAALWERDQPRDAELALANRLDVLERSGHALCGPARLLHARPDRGGAERGPGARAA